MPSVAQRLLGIGGLLVGALALIAGDRPLGDLDADAVCAGLDDDAVFLHGTNGAQDAADGGHIIADLQAVAQFFRCLLLLVLRTDEQGELVAR